MLALMVVGEDPINLVVAMDREAEAEAEVEELTNNVVTHTQKFQQSHPSQHTLAICLTTVCKEMLMRYLATSR